MRIEYYFPRNQVYDTSKFSNLDWKKWWRDKALLDAEHSRWVLDKIKDIRSKQWEDQCELVHRLEERFAKLESELEELL